MRFARWEDDGGLPGHVPLEYPPRMTDAQLRQFVLGFCDGKIFCHLHLDSPEDVRMHFMVLALGGASLIDEPENVGLIWEWLDRAGPLGINGNPCFFSCRFMHRLDWERARVAITAEAERREQVRV